MYYARAWLLGGVVVLRVLLFLVLETRTQIQEGAFVDILPVNGVVEHGLVTLVLVPSNCTLWYKCFRSKLILVHTGDLCLV